MGSRRRLVRDFYIQDSSFAAGYRREFWFLPSTGVTLWPVGTKKIYALTDYDYYFYNLARFLRKKFVREFRIRRRTDRNPRLQVIISPSRPWQSSAFYRGATHCAHYRSASAFERGFIEESSGIIHYLSDVHGEGVPSIPQLCTERFGTCIVEWYWLP